MNIIIMILGVHVDSNINNILNSVQEAYNNGCNLVQFFVSINHRDKYNDLKQFLLSKKMLCVVHISYTINCAQSWNEHSPWIHQFISEIEIADNLGAFACVVHLGKQLDLSIEESINNMYTSLLYVHQKTSACNTEQSSLLPPTSGNTEQSSLLPPTSGNTKILFETSTGQGTEMAYKLEDLAYIYRRFSKHKNNKIAERFGICVDTCHIFSAGYNISNRESRDIFFDNFNELIGLQHIKLVHLNDSKVECGARVDRHANFGNGYIGKDAINILAQVFKKLNIPMILETPYEHIFDDLRFILKN